MTSRNASTRLPKDLDIRGFNVYRIVDGTDVSIKIAKEEMSNFPPDKLFFIPKKLDNPIKITHLLRHVLHDYTEPEDRIRFTGDGKVRFNKREEEEFWSV